MHKSNTHLEQVNAFEYTETSRQGYYTAGNNNVGDEVGKEIVSQKLEKSDMCLSCNNCEACDIRIIDQALLDISTICESRLER